jgi:hypothetical protein
MPTTTSFPDGFLWGTATAAHQVEGGNWNNDWWAWEHAPGTPCPDPSGDACDHWHRYDDDIALLADIGFNAYRFGFGLQGAADVVLGLLVVAATLESVFAYCIGCHVFALLMRTGVIPAEVCERCNDIWATAGGD